LLKGGYVWDRTTHFYGLMGPRWGNFKSTVKINDSHTQIRTSEISGGASSTSSSYVLGYTFGLGVQQLLTPRYSWALEYNYTTYGSLSVPTLEGEYEQNGVPDVNTSFTYHPSAKAMTNTLMFMIAYRL
jgi:opacity protein-like surface antigen